jgi:hypothetical protein
LCAAAVPAALHGDGTPFGITFIAPGGQDALAASLAKAFHAVTGVAPGMQAKLEALALCRRCGFALNALNRSTG